jgi:hypothetical protein
VLKQNKIRKVNLLGTRWFSPLMGGVMAAVVFLIMMYFAQVTAQAASFNPTPQSSFARNYHFSLGSGHSLTLGNPTTFDGFVSADVFSINHRRDANITLRPPSYGIFNGHIPTAPANLLFPQPVSSPSIHFHDAATGGFLPPTSIR